MLLWELLWVVGLVLAVACSIGDGLGIRWYGGLVVLLLIVVGVASLCALLLFVVVPAVSWLWVHVLSVEVFS